MKSDFIDHSFESAQPNFDKKIDFLRDRSDNRTCVFTHSLGMRMFAERYALTARPVQEFRVVAISYTKNYRCAWFRRAHLRSIPAPG